jgi:lipopolysaccharide exporter
MTEKAESFHQERMIKGVAWTSLGLLLIRIFFFITSIITARLLTPEDFGIIGMAATITLLVDTTSANGIDNFIIYKQALQSHDINTAFMLNTLIAVILAGLLIFSGPIFFLIYHHPALNLFLLYAGLAFLAAMLGRIPRAFLIKEMRQGILSAIDIGSNFINFALIIGLAMAKFQYLSYVIPLLISQTLRTVLLYILAHRRFQIEINASTVRDIFAYSKNYLPQALLSYGLTQADYIIGGLLLGSVLLGYYYFGFEKAFLVVMLVRSVAVQVFFPVFANLQSEPSRLKEKYFEISAYTMFLLYPVLFIMLLCSREMIGLLYGSQWEPSLLTFQCLMAYTFLSVNFDLSVILFNAVGKPQQNLKHYAIVLPIAIAMFYMGATYGGGMGLALASALVHSFSALLMMFWLKYAFQWRISEQVKHFARFMLPLIIQLPILVPLKIFLMSIHLGELYVLSSISVIFAVLYLLLTGLTNPTILKNCTRLLWQKVNNGLAGRWFGSKWNISIVEA